MVGGITVPLQQDKNLVQLRIEEHRNREKLLDIKHRLYNKRKQGEHIDSKRLEDLQELQSKLLEDSILRKEIYIAKLQGEKTASESERLQQLYIEKLRAETAIGRLRQDRVARETPTKTSRTFEWLENLQNLRCYTAYNSSYPAKSSDFGSSGFTGSVTDWHELLQITAPDDKCGLVFVRGTYPNSPDAILERAQRRDDNGCKGTFGLQLLPELSQNCDFELGERIAQGIVNFRWPYIQYELKRKSREVNNNEQFTIGTYEMISFVMDGMVFQVIRVKRGKFRPENRGLEDGKVKFKIGGKIHFGCACSKGDYAYKTKHVLDWSESNGGIRCVNKYYQKRLEVELFVNDNRETLVHTGNTHPSRLEDSRTNEVDVAPVTSGKQEAQSYLPMSSSSAPRESEAIEVDVAGETRSIDLSNESLTVLVSVFALRNEADPLIIGSRSFLKPSDISSAMEEYLGISCRPDSYSMIDRLWAACLTPSPDNNEAMEVYTIARNVEEILCVSSIPMSLDASQALRSSEESKPSAERDCGTALIRNIMISQYVDMQSLFWQLRLLVKARNFLESRSLEQSPLDAEETPSLTEIRRHYLSKLYEHIRSILIWIVRTNLDIGTNLLPVKDQAKTLRRDFCQKQWSDDTHDQSGYASMAIWYVMENCSAIIKDFDSKLLLKWLEDPNHLRNTRKTYHADDGLDESESTRKADLLQWFHASCFILICAKVQSLYPKENPEDKQIVGMLEVMIKNMLAMQEDCALIVKRWRKRQNKLYCSADEEVDRLVFLGDDLGLPRLLPKAISELAETLTNQARARISERRHTQTFYPGPKLSPVGRTLGITSNAPWELASLNHHSLLLVEVEDSKDFLDRTGLIACFEFMLSDFTFMSSWDRSSKSMIAQWWDFEPSSVICATLIDLKVKGKLKSAKSMSGKETKPDAANEADQKDLPEIDQLEPEQAQAFRNFLGYKPDAANETDQKDLPQIVKLEPEQAQAFRNFLAYWTQGQMNNSAKASLPRMTFDWVKRKPTKIYHPESWIRSLVGTPTAFQMKQTEKVPLSREVKDYLRERKEQFPDEWTISNVWTKILPADLQFLSIFDFILKEDFTFRTERATFPTEADDNNQKKHLSRLSSSLVDLGIKYRILFAEKCCPSVVKGFIYLWHPDALDTFGNHFGTASRFLDNRETTWTTSITVSHWSLKADEDPVDKFDEGRYGGMFPPQKVVTLVPRGGQGNSEAQKIIERCSSVVITGDQYGYFWICSAWCPLTTDLDENLPSVLQTFLHQQASGRCLIFLILLGHVCEKLANDYGDILNRLDEVVELGKKVLIEGLKWETKSAVGKLKQMLWVLEVLRILDDTVSSSMSQIQRAKEIMDRTIKQEGGEQHIELLQEHNNIIEKFSKRQGVLMGVQTKIELRIQQVTGLRDGTSAVTIVEDSHTTIKQGNNIRVLTLITIAYLPLGFINGLFAANHNILSDNVGLGLFIGLIFVFVVVTYGVALSLESILGFLETCWTWIKSHFKKPDSSVLKDVEKG